MSLKPLASALLTAAFLFTPGFSQVTNADTAGPTSVIEGHVLLSQCPPNDYMGMPCVLETIEGATVVLNQVYYGIIDPAVINEPANGSIGILPDEPPTALYLETLSGPDGSFRFELPAPMPAGTEFQLFAQKDESYGDIYMMLSGSTTEIANIYLYQPAPPPTPAGFASVLGTVRSADGQPAAGAWVSAYAGQYAIGIEPEPVPMPYPIEIMPALDGVAAPDSAVSSEPGISYPPYWGFTAITDANGQYRIDSIPIYGNPAIMAPITLEWVTVTASTQGGAYAEGYLTLSPNAVDTLDLTLSEEPPAPVVLGQAGVAGVVYINSCATDPATDENLIAPECMMIPVPQCTVLVSAAIMPMAEARDMIAPPYYEGLYMAVTDENGRFLIGNIDMYMKELQVSVMGSKGGLFGSVDTWLTLDQTVEVNLMLDEIPVYIVDNGDTVTNPEVRFYEANRENALSITPTSKAPRSASLALESGKLVLRLDAPRNLTLSLHALDGRLEKTLFSGKAFAAGRHPLSLEGLSSARPVIIRMSGEGFQGSLLAPASQR